MPVPPCTNASPFFVHAVISLFSLAAWSLSVVRALGDHSDWLWLPFFAPRVPSAEGRMRLTQERISLVVLGHRAARVAASLAWIDSVTSASPLTAARTIRLAARRALIDVKGRESMMLNQAYSAWCWPLKSALRGLSVRIRSGTTVVT